MSGGWQRGVPRAITLAPPVAPRLIPSAPPLPLRLARALFASYSDLPITTADRSAALRRHRQGTRGAPAYQLLLQEAQAGGGGGGRAGMGPMENGRVTPSCISPFASTSELICASTLSDDQTHAHRRTRGQRNDNSNHEACEPASEPSMSSSAAIVGGMVGGGEGGPFSTEMPRALSAGRDDFLR